MITYTSHHSDTAANHFIDIIFEVTSAFGTVGMSLGSLTARNASFSCDLSVKGQLCICILMILGRHRGFPSSCYPLDYYKNWDKTN